jgi:two-component system sensor histidine kinase UhpB
MKDERKTKRQLIDELTQLRQRLSEERRQLTEARRRADELGARNQDDAVRQRVEEALRASAEQWYVTFNAMSDAICLIDPMGSVQRCNRAMVELLDKPLSEILGHRCWEVVHGTSEPIDECPVTRMRKSLSRESMTVLLGDRWFNVSVDPVLADDGQIAGAVHVMTDVTERKQIEEVLREGEAKVRSIIEQSLDGIVLVDERGIVIEWNQGEERITGIKQKEALGEFIWNVQSRGVPGGRGKGSEVRERLESEITEFLRTGESSWDGRQVENEFRRPDGTRRFIQSVSFPIKTSKGFMIGSISRDVTERKQAEEALAEQAKQLRLLSARLAGAQEAERRRMARELHDQVGQNLTALGINLSVLHPYLAQAPETAQSIVDNLLALVKETSGRIRDVMVDLRPPELDDYGLLSALRWYAERVRTRTGLTVAVEGEAIHPRLSSQEETALFRIAQEALANAVKHAQATRAVVTVEVSAETVRMTIADDGKGFDPASLERADAAPHWGLLTMQERAQAIGARWHVESAPGQGTRVVVEMARQGTCSKGGE